MSSLRDYWDLFVLLEYNAVRDGLERVLHPIWQSEVYLWVMVAFVAWESLRPWRPRQRRWRAGAALDLFYTVFNYMLFWVPDRNCGHDLDRRIHVARVAGERRETQ